MKRLLALSFLPLAGALMAQPVSQVPAQLGTASATLDVSNINTKILMGGDMFWDLSNPAFEVPRGSGKHSIYAGALWIGGVDQNNQLYVAQQTYRQGSPSDAGFWPGPICNSATQGATHSQSWDKIWKVSRAEIQNHIANYSTPGYTAPAGILTWPANGNTSVGEAAQLAPFVDVNSDGIYSPGSGDYPKIKGDQALYLILNDAAGIKEPQSPAMGLEVHAMYYGYDNTADPEVYNTLYTEYRLVNRGALTISDMYAGMWMDLDIGNYTDDYIGCDTLNNRFFAYNGDNDDDGADGYGLNPPVQSVSFLDKKMSHFMYYNNDFSDQGNPSTSQHYYNYLRSIWKNNAHMMYGGDGFTAVPGVSSPFNFMFPGDPVTQTGWTENHTLATPSVNTPADRRGVGSVGPFTLAPGQEYSFTVAYTYSRGTSNLNSVTQAQADVVTVKNHFTTSLATTGPLTPKSELFLQPNPATDQLQIQVSEKAGFEAATIRITDLTGKEMLQTHTQLQGGNAKLLNIASLSKGMYLVSVTSGGQTTSAKLVKL